MSDNIPFEIQAEIIKRVHPVKSLIQFRSVSKQWMSLIDSSEFITHHSLNQTQPHHLLVMNKLHDSEYQFISIVDDDDDVDSFPQHKFSPCVPPTVKLVRDALMLDCTHGVVCLYGSHRDTDIDDNFIVLWNPSIRKSVGILLPLELSVVGFGICPKTSDLKIVKVTCVTSSSSSIHWEAEVLTLGSGGWRSVPVNLPVSFKFHKHRSGHVVVDGVIYWRARDLAKRDTERIISFDLTSEEFGEVRIPDCLGSPNYLTISKFKESLVVVIYLHEHGRTRRCDAWRVKKNGDIKSLISNLYISFEEADGSDFYIIIGFRKNGLPITEHIYNYYEDVSSRLKVYDPSSKHISDLGIDSSHVSPFMMTSYSDSLLLLNHPNSMI